jgi:hypothetical protein
MEQERRIVPDSSL